MMFRASAIVGVALVLASTVSPLHADEITLTAADGQSAGQTVRDVKVTTVEGDVLQFQLPNGNRSTAPLARVRTINLTNDPSFTAAETAYAAGDVAGAVDHYLKAIRTNDAWKVRRIAPRLIGAAGATRRFDAAIVAYASYARVDPAAAAGSKPALPAKGSAFLDDAARQLEGATKAATGDAERQALLALALDVQLARGDQAAAQAIADQIAKLAAANPNASADPSLAALSAGVKLSQARLAIRAGRFADATAAIDAIADGLTEPRQVAEALFIRAEAKAGLASKEDGKAQLDVAAAFMRVVANASANETEPFVSDALLRAAKSLADAKDVTGALALCRQIAAEFPNAAATPSAAALAKTLQPPAK